MRLVYRKHGIKQKRLKWTKKGRDYDPEAERKKLVSVKAGGVLHLPELTSKAEIQELVNFSLNREILDIDIAMRIGNRFRIASLTEKAKKLS